MNQNQVGSDNASSHQLEREIDIQVVHQKPFTRIEDEEYTTLHDFEYRANWYGFELLKIRTIQFLNHRGYIEPYETSVYE